MVDYWAHAPKVVGSTPTFANRIYNLTYDLKPLYCKILN